MNITNFYAYPVYPEAVRLQWDTDNKELGKGYRVDLFYSGSPKGPWEVIQKNIIDKYFHLFRYTELLDLTLARYFKMVLTPPVINCARDWTVKEKVIHLFAELEPFEFLQAQEIVRKENLRFTVHVGQKVKIFKRRFYGDPCTKCLDKLTGAILNSQCQVCMGTRYISGYFDPVDAYADIDEQPVQKSLTDINTVENRMAQVRLTNEVLVNKLDLIVEPNFIWKVAQEPFLVKHRSYPIVQTFTAFAVNPKSVEFKLVQEIT